MENERRKIRVLTGSGGLVVEHVLTSRSAIIITPDQYHTGRGADATDRLSMHPTMGQLEQLDAGGSRANVGRVIVPPVKNPDGLKEGDIVLYDQHSARMGFTMDNAKDLRRLLGTEGFCYIIHKDALCGVVEDGVPEAGTVR